MDTMEFVKLRLRDPDADLRVIAEGAGVGYSWIRMFARGRIPDPGYSRIRALNDYFLRVDTEQPVA